MSNRPLARLPLTAALLGCAPALLLRPGLSQGQGKEAELSFSAALLPEGTTGREVREFAPGEPIPVRIELRNDGTRTIRAASPLNLVVWFELKDEQGTYLPPLPSILQVEYAIRPQDFVDLAPGERQSLILDLTLAVGVPADGPVRGRLTYVGGGKPYGFWTGRLPSEEIEFVVRPRIGSPAHKYLGLCGAKWWHSERHLDLALEMYSALVRVGPREVAKLAAYYLGVLHEEQGHTAEAAQAYEATLRDLPGTGAALLAEAALERLKAGQP